MKKIFIVLSVSIFLFGCSSEKNSGWQFNKENTSFKTKNQGFIFDQTDYSKKDDSAISNEHSGCTKSCCSKQ